MSRTVQRILGAAILLVAGVFSLPLAATFLDGEGTENWIVVVQLAVMALLGALLALTLPALAREDASPVRRAVTGVWWGLLGALVGVLVFWFLLSGVGGA
ncbi:MAG: hypothetical protein ACI379_14230 [Nocardioides sp.]|uniref:hypothetical protein n=1 Tax=Nocardioides sp. TaxID=35761 RepID=UPI003EFC52AD